MKVINENKRLLFTLKEKTSGTLVVAPEDLILVEESLQETPTPVDSRPYKVYTALLTQTGTNAPVATVLENTLGGYVTITREYAGVYTLSSSGLFLQSKTTLFLGSISDGDTSAFRASNFIRLSNNQINLTTGVNVEVADGFLNDTPIEIRVYN